MYTTVHDTAVSSCANVGTQMFNNEEKPEEQKPVLSSVASYCQKQLHREVLRNRRVATGHNCTAVVDVQTT